jgi:hypothetical protein
MCAYLDPYVCVAGPNIAFHTAMQTHTSSHRLAYAHVGNTTLYQTYYTADLRHLTTQSEMNLGNGLHTSGHGFFTRSGSPYFLAPQVTQAKYGGIP